MFKPLFFCLLSIVLSTSLCLAAAPPAYQARIASQTPGQKLSIDCVLNAPVDEATLRTLGERVYKDHRGSSYKNVFIMWYLPQYKIGAGVWGITNFIGSTPQVRIMALQG